MKIRKNDWSLLVLGLRKKLNLSQAELANNLGFARCSILRYENNQKFPRKKSIAKILDFADKNGLDTVALKKMGLCCKNGFMKDRKLPKLNLRLSEELTELIGILLGDGEIMKDGTLRISFDPKKDKNFLYRRMFSLIHSLLGNNISFESYKRIVFYNISFVRYLKEDCRLNPGSKFENNWEIPELCFEKEIYLSAVLRGLFDTDGYFGYLNGSLELMFGRFSSRCGKLVNSIERILKYFNFKYKTSCSKDGRYRIRIQNKKDVISFFRKIGTSNLKHIVRFLLWRIIGYEAKIELEGLNKLVDKTNRLIDFNIRKIDLPFLWGKTKRNEFIDYIQDDNQFIRKRRKRTKNL